MRLRFLPALTAFVLLAAPVFAEAPPAFLLQWGNFGNGNDGFFDAMGIATDPSGNVLVVDRIRGLRRYTNDGVYVQTLALTYSQSQTGPLLSPAKVAIAPNGDFYLTQQISTFKGTQGVIRLNSSGALLSQWGDQGSGPGQFLDPWGLCIVGNEVYVVDSGNDRVQVFDLNGTFLRAWTTQIPANMTPNDIAIRNGIAYVVMSNDDLQLPSRVETYTTAGAFLGAWSAGLPDDPGFSYCDGIDVDATGVYVADAGAARVKKFDPNGTALSAWNGSGQPGGNFSEPEEVALDATGNVFVADRTAYRVQKYGSIPTPTSVTSWGRLRARYR